MNKMKEKIMNIMRRGYHSISKVKLPFLVISLGQACTLKCRDCANFSPYAKKENLFYPYEKIIDDLNDILKICKCIDVVQVQGGEPFIYSDLDKILQFLILNKKVKNVHIATNGTIVPMGLFKLLRSEKVVVRISNYKVVESLKIENLCAILDDEKISYSRYGFIESDDKWTVCGQPDMTREDDNEIAASRFEKCLFNHCLTLENGVIGKCSRSIHAMEIQKFTPKSNDHIWLRECKDLRKELHRYIDKNVPQNKFFMEACRFCYGTFYGPKVEPAIQLGKNNADKYGYDTDRLGEKKLEIVDTCQIL